MTPFGKFKKRTFSWVSSPTMDAVGHEGGTSSARCCEPLDAWPIREARMLSGFPGRIAPNNLTESDLREGEKRRFVLSRSLPNAQSKHPHN